MNFLDARVYMVAYPNHGVHIVLYTHGHVGHRVAMTLWDTWVL